MSWPYVIIDYRSEPPQKAFALGNDLGTFLPPAVPQSFSPQAQVGASYPDGFYSAGQSRDGVRGGVAPGRLRLWPYCDGNPGSTFSVRLYGWDSVGNPDENPSTVVWFPYLLVELLCVSCGQSGPSDGQPGISSRAIKDTEFFCDTITLVQGNLGNLGLINSTGPGTNLIAFAIVDLCGSRVFSFDFQQTDPVGMNCLWARA